MDDKWNGKGIYFHKNGKKNYDGKNRKPKNKINNNCLYLGEFKLGQKNGNGVIFWYNGNKQYEGMREE